MPGADLDPVEERLQPLAQAIGRVVLGAAALERVLVVDIAQRRAAVAGVTQRLERELATLERKPSGELLKALREIGIPDELATRIGEFISRRNWLVHRLMEDPDAFRAFATGDGTEALVERVDQSPRTARRSSTRSDRERSPEPSARSARRLSSFLGGFRPSTPTRSLTTTYVLRSRWLGPSIRMT